MPLRPSQGGSDAPTGSSDGSCALLPAPPADFVPTVEGRTAQRPSPSKRIRIEEVDPASTSVPSQPTGAAQAATTGSTSDATSDDELEPPEMADEDEETPVLVDIIADQLAPNEEDAGGAPLTADAARKLNAGQLRDAAKARSLGHGGNKPDRASL